MSATLSTLSFVFLLYQLSLTTCFLSAENDALLTCHCNYCLNETSCQTTHYCFSTARRINDTYYTIKSACAYGLYSPIPIPEFCEYEDYNEGVFTKCCFLSYCNNYTISDLLPSDIFNGTSYLVPPKPASGYSVSRRAIWVPIVCVFVALLLLIVILPLILHAKRHGHRRYPRNIIISFRRLISSKQFKKKGRKTELEQVESAKLTDYTNIAETLGLGETWLNNSSIAKQIELGGLIGAGRFGQVFKGTWNCQQVAVKVFLPTSAENGEYEAFVYRHFNLRHENVLCFISSDKIFINNWLQTWLVFDYHSKGSLHYYLSSHDITIGELVKIVVSVAAGLCYLHLEIVGSEHFKPAMAHRDVKSSNVLLKNDGNCCISDLGCLLIEDCIRSSLSTLQASSVPSYQTALIGSPSHGSPYADIAVYQSPLGTKRYLPPESLLRLSTELSFETVQKGDVYAFGLMIWELGKRVKGQCQSSNYEVVFENELPGEPRMQEIYQLVVEQRIRPLIPTEWTTHPVLKNLKTIMQDCWFEKPESRPQITNIRRRLHDIYYSINHSLD